MTKQRKKKKVVKKMGNSLDLFFLFAGVAILIMTLIAFQYLTAIEYQFLIKEWNLIINFALMKDVPLPLSINVLADGLTLFTGIYGGLEGGLSALKSMNMPVGISAPVPKFKLEGMLFMCLIWVTLFFSSLYFTVNAQTAYSFSMQQMSQGLMTGVLGYVWMRKSKFAEGINISKDTSVPYQTQVVYGADAPLANTQTVGQVVIPKKEYPESDLK